MSRGEKGENVNMKNLFCRTLAILIVIVLVSSPMAILPAFAANIPTFATLGVGPNPGGVGQELTVSMTVSPDPPPGSRFLNSYFAGIRDPDGLWTVVGPFSSQVDSGFAYFTFVPDQDGTYLFNFNYTGNTIGLDTYLASAASPQSVTVNPTSFTSAVLNIVPNPSTVNCPLTISGQISPAPPSPNVYSYIYVNVTKPDGQINTIGPFTSDASGLMIPTTYTPTSVGTYHFRMYKHYETFSGVFYAACYSSTVDVIIHDAPSVSISPSSVTMDAERSQWFYAGYGGGTFPYSFQWCLDGSLVSGATYASWAYIPTSEGSHSVYVVITDSVGGSATSNTASVTVNAAFSVGISPSVYSVTLDDGQVQVFSASASGGTSPLSYQWYLDDSAVPGETDTSYSYTATFTGGPPHWVYVVVTDSASSPVSLTSNTVGIYVSAALGVSVSPVSWTMNVGQSKTFDATPSGGTFPLTYQWYLDGGVVYSGPNSWWTYSPSSSGSHSVYVVATDAVGGSAMSNTASVTVNGALGAVIVLPPVGAVLYVGHPQLCSSTVSGGTSPYSYQWYLDGGLVSGATSATWLYVPSSVGIHNIYVVVTDGASASATSAPTSVYVQATASITISNTVDVPPESEWTYLLMQGTTVVKEFTLLPGGGSISYTDLTPGTYSLAQTNKFSYYVASATVNTDEVLTTTGENTTVLTLGLISGDAVSVVFNNALIPPVEFAKPAGDGDSTPPSTNSYNIPCLRAVPVQSSWDPDIEPDTAIDLVMGKPIKIMVNLVDLLATKGGPIDPASSAGSVSVSVTSADGFFNTPLGAMRSGVDINTNSVIIFDMDPPSTLGPYTITCKITVAGTTYSETTTLVSVKETSELALYYTHLSRSGDYGTETEAAFNAMLTNTRDFVKAVYPVPQLAILDSGTTSIAGAAYEANYVGMLKDCQKIAIEARLKFPNIPNVIGVAIGPYQSKTSNYFKYHGAVSGGKTAVGVSFGPGVKGVVVSDGYYTTAAHEIAHTFGLYYGVPEQYTICNPGAPASGFWIEKNEWRNGYDFMGLSPYQSTTSMWVSSDTTFEPNFRSLKITGDPQMIIVNGIIYDNGVVDLPFSWYSMPYGTPDAVPEGRYALRFTLASGETVVTTFEASTWMHLDPGIEVGEDLQADYSGFGRIPLNFAGFAFATYYPPGTVNIELLDTEKPQGEQVIKTINPASVVPSVSAYFGGFLPPIKNDGSSIFKLKSTVPIKFQLQEPQGAFITNAVAKISFAKVSNGILGDELEATTNVAATTGNLFRLVDNQYIFNWGTNTKSLTTGTYQLKVTFEDGVSKTVLISLK